MRRILSGIAIVALAGCGGGKPPSTGPTPKQAAAAETGPAAPETAAIPTAPPVPPHADVPEADQVAALARQSADSAADGAVLDQLATTDAAPRAEAVTHDNPLEGGAVTWDIDVESYIDHSRVQYWLEFFQNTAHDRFAVWLERMPRYEPMIRARLRAEGLPGDLVYLALIESGFSNAAVSRARAVGMWQFMRGTARGYGLRMDRWMDERRDPIKATDAAARHLHELRDRFGSLFLAAAAYNAGGGKVSRGLRRLDIDEEEVDSAGFSDDHFFQLYDTRYLKQETKDYVPKLIAAALIAKEPQKYGFTPAATPALATDSLVVPDMTGFDVLARVSGSTVAELRELNPQFMRLTTPPGRAVVVRLPVGAGEEARAQYAALSPSERVTFAMHTARQGETFTALAKHYGVSVATLRAANPTVRGATLRRGTAVLVPTGGPVSAEVARQLAAAGTPSYHRVRRGETLLGIARRYGVSSGELREWNRLGRKTSRVRAGVRLRVSEGDDPPAVAARPAPRPRQVATATPAPAKSLPRLATAAQTQAQAARRHRVQSGDTLTSLARRYGTTVQALADLNGFGADTKIKAGSVIRIPA